jgi:hypothetical protein
MKKSFTILFIALIFCAINSKAQATYFGADVVIENKPGNKQTSVKLASAFNGWLYSAIQYTNAANDSNGVIIKYSKDKGFTWKTMDGYKVASANAKYDDVEIAVAGTDTNNLQFYLSGIRNNVASNNYVIYIDKYNARTGNFSGSIYNLSGATRVYDLAMATDYMYPASGTTGYSLGLLYSRFGSVNDSIIYLASIDGGVSISIRQTVATTPLYFRNVSISYGRSASGSNGRYFGAWERLPSTSSRNGNIYSSRSQSTVSGNWIAPKNLDSLSSAMIGLCRNPRVMTSSGTTDNDSASVSEIVLVERDFQGAGTDYDLLGFFNNRAHFTNFWYRFDVQNNGTNHQQPDVAYHDSARTFLISYYDSTLNQLNYDTHGFNFNGSNASTWSSLKVGYNDIAAGSRPLPRIAYNPKEKKLAAAWISQTGSNNSKALFDSEYNTIYSRLAGEKPKTFEITIFPNPTKDFVYVNLNLKTKGIISYELYDLTGKLVSNQSFGSMAGEQSLRLDFSNLVKGLYVLQISAEGDRANYKLTIE